MAAFVIPASVSADSFVAAPSSRHLRASAPTVQAASAPSTGSAGSALAAVALAGAVAVGAAGARRARRAQRVAVRAENPRADKLRTMEKTVQAGGSENSEVFSPQIRRPNARSRPPSSPRTSPTWARRLAMC